MGFRVYGLGFGVWGLKVTSLEHCGEFPVQVLHAARVIGQQPVAVAVAHDGQQVGHPVDEGSGFTVQGLGFRNTGWALWYRV